MPPRKIPRDRHPIAAHFGDRLRELRAAAGLSQEQLAERAGLSQGSIALYEGGSSVPSWDAVLRLSDALRGHPRDFETPPKKNQNPVDTGN